MNENNKLRYKAYVRKSTEEDSRQVQSLEKQEEAILARFKDLNIIGKPVRESMSGGKAGIRPAFNKLLEEIEAGKIDGIVALNSSRLSRNSYDSARLDLLLQSGKLKDLKFVEMGFDNTPEGIMMLNTTNAFNQYFVQKLSKDVKLGMEKKNRDGGLCHKAPIGYLNIIDPLGSGKRLVVKDEERFDKVLKLWEMMATGAYTATSIRDYSEKVLNLKTKPTPKSPAHSITRSGIYKIFENIRYAGLVPKIDNPNEMVPANFPAMVDLEMFNKVQVLLGRRGKPNIEVGQEPTLKYKGLLTCEVCGCSITGMRKFKYYKGTDRKVEYKYYHCTGMRGCSKKGISEQELEKQIFELLDKYTISPELQQWAYEALDEINKEEYQNSIKAIKDRESARNKLIEKRSNLVSLLADGILTPDLYKEQEAVVSSQIKEEEIAIERARNHSEGWRGDLNNTIDFITNIKDRFEIAGLEDRIMILNSIGTNPVLTSMRTLSLTAYKWLIPLKEGLPEIRYALDNMRTPYLQGSKVLKNDVRLKWCG